VPGLSLLTVGEAFEDLIFFGLPRLPEKGEELRTEHFFATLGGGAVITAVAAARLRLPVVTASGLSDAAVRRLRRERVGVQNLRRAEERVAVSASLSTLSDRAFVTFDGVNTRLGPRFVRAVAAAKVAHVHLALYPRDCARWLRLITRVRRQGVTVSADFGWNEQLAADVAFAELVDALDVLFVNELEAQLYAPARTVDAAFRRWRKHRAVVIVKRGEAGSVWLDRHHEVVVDAPPTRVVDTTGAGDAFNGGFLWSWLRAESRERCLAVGNFVGARSTRHAGGLDGLPYLRDLPVGLRRTAVGRSRTHE